MICAKISRIRDLGMIDRQLAGAPLVFFSGAPVAQNYHKSLKSFAPLKKSSGANDAACGAIWHKKTPETMMVWRFAPLLKAEVLRTLTSGAAPVNTLARLLKMSVRQKASTRSFLRPRCAPVSRRLMR